MTDKKTEALKLALDFLDSGMPSDPYGMDKEQHQIAITALRQALEQPEQDMPCGWVNENGIFAKQPPNDFVYSWKPVYTAPRKRGWVGLTDEEIQKVAYDMGTIGDLSHDEFDICRAVIAKLKEKNHD